LLRRQPQILPTFLNGIKELTLRRLKGWHQGKIPMEVRINFIHLKRTILYAYIYHCLLPILFITPSRISNSTLTPPPNFWSL
jgi:hypothetical protein